VFVFLIQMFWGCCNEHNNNLPLTENPNHHQHQHQHSQKYRILMSVYFLTLTTLLATYLLWFQVCQPHFPRQLAAELNALVNVNSVSSEHDSRLLMPVAICCHLLFGVLILTQAPCCAACEHALVKRLKQKDYLQSSSPVDYGSF